MNSLQKAYGEQFTRLKSEIETVLHQEFPDFPVGEPWTSKQIIKGFSVEIAIQPALTWQGELKSGDAYIHLTACAVTITRYSRTWPYTPENLTIIIEKAKTLIAEERAYHIRALQTHNREHDEKLTLEEFLTRYYRKRSAPVASP